MLSSDHHKIAGSAYKSAAVAQLVEHILGKDEVQGFEPPQQLKN